jgi:hypothetical protein
VWQDEPTPGVYMYAKKLHTDYWSPPTGRLVLSQKPWLVAAEAIPDEHHGLEDRTVYMNRVSKLQHGIPNGRPYPVIPGRLPIEEIRRMMKEHKQYTIEWSDEKQNYNEWWETLCADEEKRIANACPTCERLASEGNGISISSVHDEIDVQKQKRHEKAKLRKELREHVIEAKRNDKTMHQPVTIWPDSNWIKISESTLQRGRQQQVASFERRALTAVLVRIGTFRFACFHIEMYVVK